MRQRGARRRAQHRGGHQHTRGPLPSAKPILTFPLFLSYGIDVMASDMLRPTGINTKFPHWYPPLTATYRSQPLHSHPMRVRRSPIHVRILLYPSYLTICIHHTYNRPLS